LGSVEQLTPVEAAQSPHHHGGLEEKLGPHEHLEKWRSLNKELVFVGVDIEVLEAEHEARDAGSGVDGLKVHD